MDDVTVLIVYSTSILVNTTKMGVSAMVRGSAEMSWFLGPDCSAASQLAHRHGWRAFFGTATKTSQGGLSGGVAILVRGHLRVEEWPLEGLPQHRAVAVVLRLKQIGDLVLVSYYGDVHSASARDDMCHQLKGRLAVGNCIVGGDFNSPPGETGAHVGLLSTAP